MCCTSPRLRAGVGFVSVEGKARWNGTAAGGVGRDGDLLVGSQSSLNSRRRSEVVMDDLPTPPSPAKARRRNTRRGPVSSSFRQCQPRWSRRPGPHTAQRGHNMQQPLLWSVYASCVRAETECPPAAGCQPSEKGSDRRACLSADSSSGTEGEGVTDLRRPA